MAADLQRYGIWCVGILRARCGGGVIGKGVGQPANQVRAGRLLAAALQRYRICAYGILLLLGAVMISGYSVVTGSATV